MSLANPHGHWKPSRTYGCRTVDEAQCRETKRGNGHRRDHKGTRARGHGLGRLLNVPQLSPNCPRRASTPVGSCRQSPRASPCLSAFGRRVATMVPPGRALRIPLGTPDSSDTRMAGNFSRPWSTQPGPRSTFAATPAANPPRGGRATPLQATCGPHQPLGGELRNPAFRFSMLESISSRPTLLLPTEH